MQGLGKNGSVAVRNRWPPGAGIKAAHNSIDPRRRGAAVNHARAALVDGSGKTEADVTCLNGLSRVAGGTRSAVGDTRRHGRVGCYLIGVVAAQPDLQRRGSRQRAFADRQSAERSQGAGQIAVARVADRVRLGDGTAVGSGAAGTLSEDCAWKCYKNKRRKANYVSFHVHTLLSVTAMLLLLFGNNQRDCSGKRTRREVLSPRRELEG